AAGLRRLGLGDRITAPLAPEVSTPAPGQGALGLELRADDEQTRLFVDALNHPESRVRIAAERALMDAVGGGCSVPLGAYAEVNGDALKLLAVLATPDGARVIREIGTGSTEDPARVGRDVAERLLAQGGLDLLGRN
ncbi:MAG: hydroxymethylbilane synthase, partial [Actinomycetota bacterium]